MRAPVHVDAAPQTTARELRRPLGALALVTCAALGIGLFGGCSSKHKKLHSGGGMMDQLVYGVFGADRGTEYYYNTAKNAHDEERFCYRCTADPFLVDKSIDATYHLGHAQYARLEGQAQVVVLLTDILLEDPAALAQANAANSLTRLTLKLPPYRLRGPEERGDRFLAQLKEMDGMHDAERKRRRPEICNFDYYRQRMVAILTQIGDYEMQDLGVAKDALKVFYTRDYLIDARDPQIRAATDTALSKRMHSVSIMALRAAIDADVGYVREEAIRGLKVLNDRGAEEAVLARLDVERDWRVRAEIVEYLGKSGGAEAVATLIPMLEDGDATLRYKSRQSLTRIAGQNLGIRRKTWTRWAVATYPDLRERFEEPKPDDEQPAAPPMR